MAILSFLTGAAATLAALYLVARRVGFQAQASGDYSDGPGFDIRKALNGPMLCDGVIYGPTGRVTSRFVAEMDGNWSGNSGQMREHFRYDSGTTQDREWRLSVDESGRITAEADDLVGRGTGQQAGSAVCLNYTIRLPDSAGGHTLNVTDWMYLLENGIIINRSQFRKFGIKVGELVATMRPNPERTAKKEAA